MWPYDQNNQQMYQQYADAHNTGDYSNIDQDQAMNNVQQFTQNAPPDIQQQVYQQHFEQMPVDQRAQFAQQMPQQYAADPNDPQAMAQGFSQMGQEQPGMLSQLFGQSGISGGQMNQGSGGITGLVGTIAQHMLSNQGGRSF